MSTMLRQLRLQLQLVVNLKTSDVADDIFLTVGPPNPTMMGVGVFCCL